MVRRNHISEETDSDSTDDIDQVLNTIWVNQTSAFKQTYFLGNNGLEVPIPDDS